MAKRKEKFIEKIVKKDYSDELETILEEKKFNVHEKNILLNILYKVEGSYKDYENVKRNVPPKDEFMINIIKNIKNNCDKIQLVKPTQKKSEILGTKTFIINRKNKEIICYPIERKVLYCIYKISTKPKIVDGKYFLLNETLSNLINLGSCIDKVEVIRDFNGFSWTTIKSEIESVEYNLIYQNLRFLIGYEFLNNWEANKDTVLDYYELFNQKLIESYGKDKADSIVKLINELSILLQRRYDRGFSKRMKSVYNENILKIEETKDMQKFIENISEKKKKIAEEVGRIDEILKQFEKLNELLNPKKFVAYKKELLDRQEKLNLIYCKDFGNDIDYLLVELQKRVLECFKIKIDNAKTKSEIINLFYELRYYGKIPFNRKDNIIKTSRLKEDLYEIQSYLIKKAYKLKVVNNFSNYEKLNIEIIKSIFKIRTIELTDLCIKVENEKDKIIIQVYDEEMLEKEIKINIKDIDSSDEKVEIKLNKKMKIFLK
ncbi:MAG: hypothetical protein IJH39_08645 [Clostridia bacterium]|nr:hypothetical protein [Clostridia bacterium]